LQRLQHRVIGIEHATVLKAHHQKIHIRPPAGRTPCPAAALPRPG
jgi:hypothetical protein